MKEGPTGKPHERDNIKQNRTATSDETTTANMTKNREGREGRGDRQTTGHRTTRLAQLAPYLCAGKQPRET